MKPERPIRAETYAGGDVQDSHLTATTSHRRPQ